MIISNQADKIKLLEADLQHYQQELVRRKAAATGGGGTATLASSAINPWFPK